MDAQRLHPRFLPLTDTPGALDSVPAQCGAGLSGPLIGGPFYLASGASANVAVLANVVFALAIAWLVRRARSGRSQRAHRGTLGVALRAAAQAIYGLAATIRDTLRGWASWRGCPAVIDGHRAVIIISILAAVTKLSSARSLGAISASVLGLLMLTTAVSAQSASV